MITPLLLGITIYTTRCFNQVLLSPQWRWQELLSPCLPLVRGLLVPIKFREYSLLLNGLCMCLCPSVPFLSTVLPCVLVGSTLYVGSSTTFCWVGGSQVDNSDPAGVGISCDLLSFQPRFCLLDLTVDYCWQQFPSHFSSQQLLVLWLLIFISQQLFCSSEESTVVYGTMQYSSD